jgi:ergothioneine biosynthesis protein EgtB
MIEQKFQKARKKTVELCATLENEDFVVQPLEEVSPPKWHLGHTTWFLEELILNKYKEKYQFYHPAYRKIYNSYYKGLGEHWAQGERGKLSRPSVKEVYEYRQTIETEVCELYRKNQGHPKLTSIMELAINHEEQHQELLIMDIKNILGTNPLAPAFRSQTELSQEKKIYSDEKWIEFPEGLYTVGASTAKGFSFDNETPEHKVYQYGFAISNHLVTNGEFLHFIEDKGYERPKLWLSAGWDWNKRKNIHSPLYWNRKEDDWHEFTLYGEVPLDLSAPVGHISYFEADAFARWKGMRLPREEEFEISEREVGVKNPERPALFHPTSSKTFHSQLWCWTSSHYSAYPGFTPFEGVAQEYNGKFMCNQFILRGGCFATPEGHYRETYRNFYGPEQRWMFSGIALAKDIR